VSYLLDTHTLLWALEEHPRLGAVAHRTIVDPREAVLVSTASVWEISIKAASGKLDAPDDLAVALAATDLGVLPITLDHALAAGRLPLHHRDPFDRMLVAQARVEGHVLVTADRALAAYDVEVLPADR